MPHKSSNHSNKKPLKTPTGSAVASSTPLGLGLRISRAVIALNDAAFGLIWFFLIWVLFCVHHSCRFFVRLR
ncbi:hypothetical protein F0562_035963 [Nyssa sinensis]|uniref:Uncharacterized protein n=1 Tax=Nyssa sinensis TaxID=561372 RepID=A0A5J5AEI3_9ASTE|nr:hypothetical protein F0562_035963 [Nyssa sinensis]